MKILHVTAVDFTLAIFLRAQLAALRDLGHEVHTVSSPGPLLDTLRQDGFICHETSIPRSSNPLKIMRATRRLRALFQQEKYDVVHAHTPVASVAARIAARLAGVPHVFYTAHGFYFHENMRRSTYLTHVGIERLMGRLTTHLFVQSQEDYETALRLGIARDGAATYIGNGVDERHFSIDRLTTARESVRSELGYTADDFVLSYVGRLVQEKGIDELVTAAGILDEAGCPAKFLIIGANAIGDRDSFGQHILERINSGRLREKFRFTGFTTDVPRYLAAADAFVLPSYREGLPRSIIEAMHMGLPVISTDIRGPREEVVEGQTGYLVPAKDAGALADAMQRLAANPANARNMGAAGRTRALAQFCEYQVVDRLLEIYRQMQYPRTLVASR